MLVLLNFYLGKVLEAFMGLLVTMATTNFLPLSPGGASVGKEEKESAGPHSSLPHGRGVRHLVLCQYLGWS